MMRPLKHHTLVSSQSGTSDAEAGVALGRVSLGLRQYRRTAGLQRGPLPACVSWTARSTTPRAAASLERLPATTSPVTATPRLLAARLRADGPAFFRELHGSFAADLWDATRRLMLVTDRFGIRPLYYAHACRAGCSSASSIKSLTGRSAVSARAESARHGPVLHLRPLSRRATRRSRRAESSAAAGCLDLDAEPSRLDRRTYQQLGRRPQRLDGRRVERLDRSIDDAFAAPSIGRSRAQPNLGLSLSGGLDARTILAAIDTTATPLTDRQPGHRRQPRPSLRPAAGRAGRLHQSQLTCSTPVPGRLSPRTSSGWSQLTDGQYLSQCIVMPTLPLYRQLGIEVLLRGHAGELMHMYKAYNYSLDDEALALARRRPARGVAAPAALGVHARRRQRPLFAARPAGRTWRTGPRVAAPTISAATAAIEPPLQRIWQLFLTQRLRRETALSLDEFGSVVETRLPYLDNDLVALLLAAPPS